MFLVARKLKGTSTIHFNSTFYFTQYVQCRVDSVLVFKESTKEAPNMGLITATQKS